MVGISRRRLHLLRLVLAAGVAWSAPAVARTKVLTNANIHTVNPRAPAARAMAIDDDGRIIAVGAEKDVLAAAGKDAQIIDLEGRMVLPGFQDAHVHLVEAGVNKILCEFGPFE